VPDTTATTGLILMGGGARAAYQAGVLEGLAELLEQAGWPADRNPFPVVCGTSAGAINAAAYAAGCDNWTEAIRRIAGLWRTVQPQDIYRVDLRGSLGNAAHWLGALLLGWLARTRPRSLFDNSPLRELLARVIDTERLGRCLDDGCLRALAITASSYTSGQHVTWYETRSALAPWYRTQRLAAPTRIGIDHLLASSAIPFVFPAVPLPIDERHEFFGDGSMRQSAPISPAIHLGADRLVVIGAGRFETPARQSGPAGSQEHYPSLAQIAGHAMAGIFLDALSGDIERLSRVNRTLAALAPQADGAAGLRHIEPLVISPSQRLDTLAAPHVRELPRNIRVLLRLIGATDTRGAALSSYLLFVPGYTGRLVALGRADALARKADVLRFFG
jgi:NTE family protein